MREVYYKAYRNRRFGLKYTIHDGRDSYIKEYTQQVISVTFKYSYKSFNLNTVYNRELKQKQKFYVKAGYRLEDLEFKDCVAYVNHELAGVEVDAPVFVPVSDENLGAPFYYDEKKRQYQLDKAKNETLLTREQLRKNLYMNGFWCDGIKYVRFKRSSGSSRIGKCLFVNEALAGRMRIWEKCGLNIRTGQKIDLAAWEAYVSLTTSSIIDTIELRPENILLIDDYDSVFTDRILGVGLKNKTWLDAKPQTKQIKNCIWDGQSLLDVSMFGDKYRDKSMLLLRTRFFKSACFNTNIQEFFADHGITSVSQLNGKTRATDVMQIKLITTPSSLKFLKFGTYDEWLDSLEPTFGIVKYDKPSHFFGGRMVQCHYQLLNTLQMSYEDTEKLLEPSHQYHRLLDENTAVFRHHVKCNGYSIEDCKFDVFRALNEVSYYFLGVNKRFSETQVYQMWKKDVLQSFRNNLKCGHVLIPGTYATLLGNPYEMLLQSIGKFTGESDLGVGNVYCPMFKDGEMLLGSRSPHVAAGNILLTHNRRSDWIDRYFNLSKYIVCINSINENILERLSGADMDSDTLLLTNEPTLIDCAMRHYDDFLVPTKLVPALLKKRKFNNEDRAELDHITANNRIGEIVNLSQELNSLFWDRLNHGIPFEDVADIYNDIAKLDVLSNIEIDRAKRECVVDSAKEMQKIRQKYAIEDSDGKRIKPHFFAFITKQKGYYNPKRNHYKHHLTTMDHVHDIVSKWRAKKRHKKELLPFQSIIHLKRYSERWVRKEQVEKIFKMVHAMSTRVNRLWQRYDECGDDQNEAKSILRMINDDYQNMITYINSEKLNPSTIYWMLCQIETPHCTKIRRVLWKLFFGHTMQNFRQFLADCEEGVPILKECADGDVDLYGFRYSTTADD